MKIFLLHSNNGLQRLNDNLDLWSFIDDNVLDILFAILL